MGNVKMQKVDLCVIQDNELAQVFLKTEKKPAVATVVVVDQTVPPCLLYTSPSPRDRG